MGTISDAYQRHVVQKGSSLPSPNVDTESTWTASDGDLQPEDWNYKWEDDNDGFWNTMDTGQPADPGSSSTTFRTIASKRNVPYSTDEEKEDAKVIKLTTGSIVNSDLSTDRDRA